MNKQPPDQTCFTGSAALGRKTLYCVPCFALGMLVAGAAMLEKQLVVFSFSKMIRPGRQEIHSLKEKERRSVGSLHNTSVLCGKTYVPAAAGRQ